MRDSPAQTSWTRVLLAVAASAVLLFLVLAGSMWFILAEEGVAPPPQAAVEHAGRVVRTGGAEAEAVRDAVAGDRLVVDVVDRAGAAVPGVELVLSDGRGGAERTVTTDGDGTFALEELPDSVWWEVSAEAPWSVFAPSVLRPTAAPTPQTLVVQRTCPGPVRVEHEDGAPFAGRVRDPGQGWTTLDADGRAVLPGRLCGRSRVGVGEPRGTPLRTVSWEPVEVEGDEEVVIVPLPAATAEVRVVDEGGVPVDVVLHPGEALGTGRFRLRGRGVHQRVRIARPGQQELATRIPLDGGVHEVVAPLDRTVALTLVCEACPQAVTCTPPDSLAAQNTCTGEPPDLACTCPGGEAVISGRSAPAMVDTHYDLQPLGRVAPGETERTIDISGGRASVEATWAGAVPCEVSLRRDGLRAHGDHRCMADGSVLASDLVPGEWTLTVADTTGAQVVRTLVLEPGEARDLGDLAPEGRAEARDTGG